MRVKVVDDQSSRMSSLHDKITEGEYWIEVKDTAIGQLATLNKGGERTLRQTEHDELEELLEQYEDIIIALWEAYHEDDDPHARYWRMGKVLQEEVEEDDEREMGILIPMLPFTNSDEYRQRYYLQGFYMMFKDQDWNDKDSPGTIAMLAEKAESYEKAREIYDERMRTVDVSFIRDEVRSWHDIRQLEDDPDLQLIAQKTKNRFGRTPSVKHIKNVYRLLGRDDFPPDDEIEAAIAEVEETD